MLKNYGAGVPGPPGAAVGDDGLSGTAFFQNFALENYENVQVRMSDCSPHSFFYCFFPINRSG